MTIQTPLQLVITIGIIALGTFLIRALPFFLFPAGKETPRVVAYLGAALPSASIAMLVVYRSEERRVGKECTSWCRSRWSPYH